MPVANRQQRQTTPDRLRPFMFHGLDLNVRGSHATGDCLSCGREGKLSVEVETGVWQCFVCNTKGNGLVFTRLLYEKAAESKSDAGAFHTAVAKDRRLISPATVAAWGICKDGEGSWLVPGYGVDGKLDQVYRRMKIQERDQWVWRLLPTPGIWPEGKVHALYLVPTDFDPNRPNLVICEGPWDAMALWEVWNRLDKTTNIIGVPGCNIWRDDWTGLCRKKCVTLLFDSDHPRINGKSKSRAGYDGMKRVANKISGVASSLRYLVWGQDGYDPEKPSGWDVRDHLSAVTGTDRTPALRSLFDMIQEVPKDWFSPNTNISSNGQLHQGGLESKPCSTWTKCLEAWQGAMQWRQDLSDALATLFAVCASTQQGGNQLFLHLVGSAGSGKSTMCDGLLVSQHCHNLEHLTGFHSGWRLANDQGKDCSLIARINGKTLITPEGDVMMSSPRFKEIMSQQRRIFDGKSGTTFKNTDKDIVYAGLRTPWIMALTPAMMDHDQSHLGDRFLRFVIADPPENEKRDIVRRALRSERMAMVDRSNGTAGSVLDAKTRLAYTLTGGYVDWLRSNTEEKLGLIDITEDVEDYCIDLAELSADLRARPNEDSRKHNIYECKELPTRLARQNIRLAGCLAVVLNKGTISTNILSIIRKIALDTAMGHSLNIVKWLCSPNPKAGYRLYQETGGLMIRTLEMWTGMSNERLQRYLAFLRKIDVLKWEQVRQTDGTWLLTDRVYSLYLRVIK